MAGVAVVGAALGIERVAHGVEFGIGWIDRGGGIFEGDVFSVYLELVFREGGGAGDGAAGAVEGEVGIVEEFDFDRADFVERGGFMLEGRGHLGGGVALIDEGAVGEVLVFLPVVAELVDVLYDPFCIWEDKEFGLPLLVVGLPGWDFGLEAGLDVGGRFFDVGDFLMLGLGVGGVGGFSDGVEVGEDAEVFVVGERIILVGVALGALGGDAEDAFADGVDAVEDTFDSELLGLGSAFFIGHGVAKVSGGDDVVLSCVWEEVTGDLADDEVVVSHVGVDGIDDPVAVEMHLAREVFFVSGGVGVAGDVEPFAAPFFSVVGRGEEI